MPVYHKMAKNQTPPVDLPGLPDRVQISLQEVLGSVKDALLAFSVAVGLEVLKAFMEAEVTEIAGPKGKHNPNRRAVSHGTEKGSVVLGGP